MHKKWDIYPHLFISHSLLCSYAVLSMNYDHDYNTVFYHCLDALCGKKCFRRHVQQDSYQCRLTLNILFPSDPGLTCQQSMLVISEFTDTHYWTVSSSHFQKHILHKINLGCNRWWGHRDGQYSLTTKATLCDLTKKINNTWNPLQSKS